MKRSSNEFKLFFPKNCALGYTKNEQGFYLGYCEEDTQCSCNGHSATCDENGRCLVIFITFSIMTYFVN